MRQWKALRIIKADSAIQKLTDTGNSLVVQWLGLCAFTAEGLGSIPG